MSEEIIKKDEAGNVILEDNKEDQEEKPEPAKPKRRYGRRREDIISIENGAPAWLISFTDVMALMLTFFVLLFSMSTPEREEWSAVTTTIGEHFNRFYAQFYGDPFGAGAEEGVNVQRVEINTALSIDYLHALMKTAKDDMPSLKNAVLIPRADHLILSLPQDLLFEAGEARVRAEGKKVLSSLGVVLSRIRNGIEIIGHADPRPIQGREPLYESNWDLSLARAINVAAILEETGYTRDIVVRGLSSGRYEDLADIQDEAQRMDLARRVDIVLLSRGAMEQ